MTILALAIGILEFMTLLLFFIRQEMKINKLFACILEYLFFFKFVYFILIVVILIYFLIENANCFCNLFHLFLNRFHILFTFFSAIFDLLFAI